MKEQQQDALAAIEIIQEIHRDMKAVSRTIPFAVLFTQSKVVAKSRTARFIASQFRNNPQIPTFDTEIHDRDAFSAIFATGGTVRSLDDVNNLDAAIANVTDFAGEVITKLKTNQQPRRRIA